MSKRINVIVECSIDHNGIKLPSTVVWGDGRKFPVERILHTCVEEWTEKEIVRYTVSIFGHQRFLYQEGQCWYVEKQTGSEARS